MRKWLKKKLVQLLKRRFEKRRSIACFSHPKKILISDLASFGDVVIATVLLPVLKRHYPESEISFLVSAKTAEVLQHHPWVSQIHVFEHWYKQRTLGAVLRHIWQFPKIVKELKLQSYDLAIDLSRNFWMHSLVIMQRAQILTRIGYWIEGYGSLLTHAIYQTNPNEYIGKSHLRLLTLLGIDTAHERVLPAYRAQGPSQFGPVTVIHMGTSNPLKEWTSEKWQSLVERLMKRGERVVLTGKGDREQTFCDAIASATGCTNLCNQLSWMEFARLIQGGKQLISVDSVAVHLASAVEIPCVVLFAGISPIPIWKPPYAKCRALMRFPPCAPCHAKRGCAQRTCIRDIDPDEILKLLNY